MKRERLSPQAVEAELAKLEGWSLDVEAKSMSRRFVFRDFSEAFAFMTRSALAAEQLDHHPEWTNVYKRVEVRLTTHSSGGLTELDFELARRMASFARK